MEYVRQVRPQVDYVKQGSVLLKQYRVLIAGVTSPFAAAILDQVVYRAVTSLSRDPEHDWLFRLACTAAAIALPFVITLILAIKDCNQGKFPRRSKVAVAFAALSLTLIAIPAHSAVKRWRQVRNEALHDVPAPLFETTDIFGNPQRLAEQQNKVVVVNVWATWCGPCRAEIPQLDALYKERSAEGLMVFGISNEDIETQRSFLQEVPVSYPLLTVDGQVPSFYRDVSRYPVIFLIDRQGRLRRAPGPEEPFEALRAEVDRLLATR